MKPLPCQFSLQGLFIIILYFTMQGAFSCAFFCTFSHSCYLETSATTVCQWQVITKSFLKFQPRCQRVIHHRAICWATEKGRGSLQSLAVFRRRFSLYMENEKKKKDFKKNSSRKIQRRKHEAQHHRLNELTSPLFSVRGKGKLHLGKKKPWLGWH